MRQFAIAGLIAALLSGAGTSLAQDPAKMPKPTKEHEWLQQLAGEWTTDMEANMGPGQPPMKCQGTSSCRTLGGFWTVEEHQGEMMGTKMTAIMTLGYDADKKKYIGTWVDNCQNHMWKYEGVVDAAGKTLTLHTEGPCVMDSGKQRKYKEVIEVKSKDHKTLTSSMLMDDGKWVQFMTANYRRKK